MASSSAPFQIIDDDDDFDWEAAVREIDVACEATAAAAAVNVPFSSSSSSAGASTSNYAPIKQTHQKLNGAPARQSTLDKFMGFSSKVKNAEPAPHNSNGFVDINENDFDNDGSDGKGCCVPIDIEAAKTWIYPANLPCRDYQFSITRTALFSNTLVALPTGLGKTFIAAVVMYNYFRWFPEGKIVFAAPSRPLVMQQIEACHNIVDIPQEYTIDLTGQTNPTRRASLWKEKRVFFVTPQVLEKDILSGTCMMKHLVCLVIDEAHRATGNYSYCVVVRELMAVPVQLRILALSATPGSKQQAVQNIIDNLQISTLEYRNEGDPDVLPYVHDRKIQLIKVPMGKDAVEINNLLLDVIRPFAARLSALGVLQNRDYLAFSPCDILNSRDKFHRDPPRDLPHTKYGEIEGYFAVLLTLYHTRKVLSSHGIKYAFEMANDKLQQGASGRLLSRNETLLKAKLLMQKTVDHGAPSPKLSKMLEILKMNDPNNSRVIIFSNYRGSVRDILDELANIGPSVKATEFIGQSSGKASKGQSQKVQQAVLEKFRAGVYNVIVATSIAEEGSELKGYLRKQANSKNLKKIMWNGGMNSFNFHPSPRMIPHVIRPEVQHVKLLIETFVPRGKKAKGAHPVQIPTLENKLSNTEIDLLAKYFNSSGESLSKPSLIAYRHFQAFPSRVHRVSHSFRTEMLIDAMQHLEGLAFTSYAKASSEVETPGNLSMRVEAVETYENGEEEEDCERELSENDKDPAKTTVEVINSVKEFTGKNSHTHLSLFDSELVTVDDLGNVLVSPVPRLSAKEAPESKCVGADLMAMMKLPKEDACDRMDSNDLIHEKTMKFKGVFDDLGERMEENVQASRLCNMDEWQEEVFQSDRVLQTPVCKVKSKDSRTAEDPEAILDDTDIKKLSNDSEDVAALSPRLTNFILSGVVPESPLNSPDREKDEGQKPNSGDLMGSLQKSNQAVHYSTTIGENVLPSEINETFTPLQTRDKNGEREASRDSRSPLPNFYGNQCPFEKLSSPSCSKDWYLESQHKSARVGQKQFRRLRKLGDVCRKTSLECNEQTNVSSKRLAGSCFTANQTVNKKRRGEMKQVKDARAFIEVEAEVSSEGLVSDDEDEEDCNSYDDSFIDDRINLTAADTQADSSRMDMMAIYRRSLLTQSPMAQLPKASSHRTPDSMAPRSITNVTMSSSGTKYHPTPQAGSESTTRRSEATPCATTRSLEEKESKIENRKRKSSPCETSPLPARNLENDFLLQPETRGGRSSPLPVQERKNEDMVLFDDDDDEFFRGIDLDAVEEEAARILRHKSQNQATSIPIPRNIDFFSDAPSFDLGI
nr:DEAD-box ATP-dependent RNA helicase FANCM isoform X1 [Ipomoea batatas]